MMQALVYAPFNFMAPPSWKAILKLTALKHNVGTRDILGGSHVPEIVKARHEAMHLVYLHCGRGSPWVGERFGRDHTTVLYAIRRCEGKPVRRGGQVAKHRYRVAS